MGIKGVGAIVVSSMLAWLSAGTCSAEALAGRFEATAGGHYLMQHTDRCTRDLFTQETIQCGEDWPFVGFDLAGRAQVGPWFALGVRLAGSAYVDREKSISPDERFELDRNLWLWSAAVEARFDPPAWPRALWIGGELGAVLAVTSVEFPNLARQPPDAERDVAGFLAGLAVGWDIWLSSPVLLGIEARVKAMTLASLWAPENPSRRFNVGVFPYFSFGLHAGYRW